MKTFLGATLIGLILFVSGCAPAKPPEPIACTMEYRYGLTLTINDQSGMPVEDAMITVLESDEPASGSAGFEQFGNKGVYSGLGEGRGHYKLRIEKPGYESQELDVTLEHDACHVQPQQKEVKLMVKAL